MYRLVIVAHGDNEQLHRKALVAAVEAVERVNKGPVYRAYLERVTSGGFVGVPNPPKRPAVEFGSAGAATDESVA